jgi:hypothetical protein
MTAITFVLLSACFTAIANLFLRKNLDYGGSPSGYLVIFYLFSGLAACACAPALFKDGTPFSPTMFSIGALVGILNGCLMLLTGKALALGPAGLTFAFVCVSSIVPSFVLPLVFGEPYGFLLTTGIIMGTCCILIGLFWAAYSQSDQKKGSLTWFFAASGLLLIQGTILSLLQWRCLLSNEALPSHPLIFLRCSPEEEVWFMPGMFSVAFLMQTVTYMLSEKRLLHPAELGCGSLGGIANGTATFFLLWSTQVATGVEKGIIFPCSAIATIILCNLWGQILYKERVNWWANALCSFGIILGALA